jgi:hypothetical protein
MIGNVKRAERVVAVILTTENIPEFAFEIDWAVGGMDYFAFEMVGKVLVVTEQGPELISALEFLQRWHFQIPQMANSPALASVKRL